MQMRCNADEVCLLAMQMRSSAFASIVTVPPFPSPPPLRPLSLFLQAIVLCTAVAIGLTVYCLMIRSHRKEEQDAHEERRRQSILREKQEQADYESAGRGGYAGGQGGKGKKGSGYTPAGVVDDDVQRAIDSKPVNFGAALAEEQ
jgi:hypothetical protein